MDSEYQPVRPDPVRVYLLKEIGNRVYLADTENYLIDEKTLLPTEGPRGRWRITDMGGYRGLLASGTRVSFVDDITSQLHSKIDDSREMRASQWRGMFAEYQRDEERFEREAGVELKLYDRVICEVANAFDQLDYLLSCLGPKSRETGEILGKVRCDEVLKIVKRREDLMKRFAKPSLENAVAKFFEQSAPSVAS